MAGAKPVQVPAKVEAVLVSTASMAVVEKVVRLRVSFSHAKLPKTSLGMCCYLLLFVPS
jgi:hypothetical protein